MDSETISFSCTTFVDVLLQVKSSDRYPHRHHVVSFLFAFSPRVSRRKNLVSVNASHWRNGVAPYASLASSIYFPRSQTNDSPLTSVPLGRYAMNQGIRKHSHVCKDSEFLLGNELYSMAPSGLSRIPTSSSFGCACPCQDSGLKALSTSVYPHLTPTVFDWSSQRSTMSRH